MTYPERIALFGLRTSVSYFASPTGFAKLDMRLKCAALLYDRLLLEEGVYRSTITDGGAMDFHGPLVDPRELKPVQTKRGVMAGMRVAKTGTTDFHTVMSGRVERQFTAQFINQWAEIEPLRAQWIQMGTLPQVPERRAADLAGRWTSDERERVRDVFPNQSHWLRDKVHTNLNLDLARASVLGAELLPDGLNEPLLRMKLADGSVRVIGTGDRSLRLLLPDIRNASWSDIAEIRGFSGFVELREKLRQLMAQISRTRRSCVRSTMS